MLTGNCPIQLDVLGEGRLALASRPRRSFWCVKRKGGDGKFWKDSTVEIRSEVGYKTIIK